MGNELQKKISEDLPNDSSKGWQSSVDTSSQEEMGNELQKKISEDLPNDSSKGSQSSVDTSSQGEMSNHLPDNGKRKSKKEVLKDIFGHFKGYITSEDVFNIVKEIHSNFISKKGNDDIEKEILDSIKDKSCNYEYIVRGALIKCEYGTHKRLLNLPNCHGVYINGHPVITEKDIKAGFGDDSDKESINIPSFGICRGPKEFQIGAGTISLVGRKRIGSNKDDQVYYNEDESDGEYYDTIITGNRCKPFIEYDEKKEYPGWKLSCHKMKIGDSKAITTQSFLVCKYLGKITIENSGQQNNSYNEENENNKG